MRSLRPPAKDTASFWDAAASRYDAEFEAPGRRGRSLRSRQRAVLRLLDGEPGEALDVGMGPGRLLAELSARGWRVSGLDASEQMTLLARQRLPDARDRLICGSVEQLPFADSSFDAVIATGVLEYVGYSDRTLAELARVLRPGGRAILSVPNAWSLPRFWRRGLLYPAVRAVKRFVPVGRPAPMRRPRPPGRRRFEGMLTTAGLTPQSRRHAAVAGSAARLLGESFVARVEDGTLRAAEPLAGQIVYAARKEGV